MAYHLRHIEIALNEEIILDICPEFSKGQFVLGISENGHSFRKQSDTSFRFKPLLVKYTH